MYRPLAEILADFKQPIDPSLIIKKPVFRHGKRTKEILFIHWYDLISELDRISPGWEWQIRTQFIPDRCIIEGRLTIKAEEGEFSREATGVEFLDSKGFGEPVYSAEAFALRRAMAKFGYALDLWRENELNDKGLNKSIDRENKQPAQPIKTTDKQSKTKVTESQIARMYEIAKKESGLADEDVNVIIKDFANYTSSKDITQVHYDLICKKLKEAGRFVTVAQRKELHQWTKNENIPTEVVKSVLDKLGYNQSKFILRNKIEEVKQAILEQ